jgi:hypothetical protein
MKVHFDCDVLLDVALGREPHLKESWKLLEWAESHPGKSVMAWHTAANLVYLGDENARRFVQDLLEFIEVPATGGQWLIQALRYPMDDFEDAMQVAAATAAGAQVIATRNVKDFRQSPVRAMTPGQLLELIG